jgi:hypothetical protein
MRRHLRPYTTVVITVVPTVAREDNVSPTSRADAPRMANMHQEQAVGDRELS